ncbi:Gmad2 immunoglobulin-like domain-containing protein [Alkalicella caledoniensis]|uniref:Gmad2 immunoglobulin-like domain-containing protein n=1 Tax=Alkalicella caledoniensis TaxID=2731377 RepID=A0A7G9W5V5_ALKCA|nr:Gmad2 immunoglobulin-like domain-containing protein [Alkalicella caledoniensis]QNO14067.1 Gmad2 immunoglobulin-like domain-containing protein [Alkalicella caledoniensis]
MKKKLLALTIIMLLGLTVLSACGNENAKPEGSNGLSDEINTPIGGENDSKDQEELDVADNDKEDEKQKEQDPKGNEQGQSKKEFVLENNAFKIYETQLDEVEGRLIVRGLARVFEATIQYEFEDGHYLFDKGFVTASEGAPGWGEFEIVLGLENVVNYSGVGTVIIYEESAKDGSRLHELHIPVEIPKSNDKYAVENQSFRVYEPIIDENNNLVVKGLARVFEGTIQYEFEDGHYLFDKGFVTASEGAPGWGEFEIVLDLDDVSNYYGTGTVILYEESAKDGSRLHEIHITVKFGK